MATAILLYWLTFFAALEAKFHSATAYGRLHVCAGDERIAAACKVDCDDGESSRSVQLMVVVNKGVARRVLQASSCKYHGRNND